jgi:hypothetical protein
LRLDSNNHAAFERLTRLESQLPGGEIESNPTVQATAPYWTADNPIMPSPRRQIDDQLENVEGCTVVIVPVGEVSDDLLDAVGFVIHQELNLPVCISSNSMTIPPYTRKPGLATGPQWNEAALVQVFTNATKIFPVAPLRYVLITQVDIYIEDTSYVVSTSYAWGALVSSARFGDPTGICASALQNRRCAHCSRALEFHNHRIEMMSPATRALRKNLTPKETVQIPQH